MVLRSCHLVGHINSGRVPTVLRAHDMNANNQVSSMRLSERANEYQLWKSHFKRDGTQSHLMVASGQVRAASDSIKLYEEAGMRVCPILPVGHVCTLRVSRIPDSDLVLNLHGLQSCPRFGRLLRQQRADWRGVYCLGSWQLRAEKVSSDIRCSSLQT